MRGLLFLRKKILTFSLFYAMLRCFEQAKQMHKKSFIEAVSFLECPSCGGDFGAEKGHIKCKKCGERTPVIRGNIFQFERVLMSKKTLEKTMYGPEYSALKEEIEKCGYAKGEKAVKIAALDFGCGSSRQVFDLAAINNAQTVFGLDCDLKPLKIASRAADQLGFSDIFFVQSSSSKLPFKRGVFNIVTSHQSLEHVANPSAVIKEIARVMKKGAVMETDFPNGHSIGEFTRQLFHVITMTANPHCSRISLRKALDIFVQNGMEIREFSSNQTIVGPVVYFIEGFVLRFVLGTYKLWEIRKKYYDNRIFKFLEKIEEKIQRFFPKLGHTFQFTLEKRIHFDVRKL